MEIAASSEVLIAGAGPVGLSLAIELGRHDIACVVVEPRDRNRLVPRAKLANVRTMEHLRRWGIADSARRASPLPAGYSTDVSFVTSLRGHEITRFTNVFFTDAEGDPRFAEPAQQIPQYILEPVLRSYAETLPSVSFMDDWRVDGLVQRPDGVEIDVCRDADRRRLFAQYVVGCDGASSTVRQQLGIAMVGRRSIARNYGVVFRAPDLAASLRYKPALHFWTVNAATPSYMGPADQHGLWWLQATAIDPAIDMATIDPLQVIYGAIGGEMPVEVVNLDPWEAHALTAERLCDGRVFLAGDAAHLHSPMGAHGMNQGIGDAVDLGWKLAAVLRGWAGPGLLASYAAERGPLHVRVTEEATANYGLLANNFVRPGLDDDGSEGETLRQELAVEIQRHKRREFYSLGLVLGHVYENSPIVVADGSPPPPPEVETFTPRARPGGRAPHVWLSDGSSLFDHFGLGMTLLCLDQGVDTEPIARMAAARGIPLHTLAMDEPQVAAAYERPLVLIRPDQVVAWHGDRPPEDVERLLDVVTGTRPLSDDTSRYG